MKGIQDHQEQKQRLVENNEKLYIAWRVTTLEQHSKHVPTKTIGWPREPVHQSLAIIDQLVNWSIFIRHFKCFEVSLVEKCNKNQPWVYEIPNQKTSTDE
jgi:hypothetical protein